MRREPPALSCRSLKPSPGGEDLVPSNYKSKRTCPACAAEWPDQDGKVVACPNCAAEPVTETAAARPLQSVWGAPCRK